MSHYTIEGDPSELFGALAAAQAEMPSLTKGKKATVPGRDGKPGYTYAYADLADVLRAALPVLAKHGLCVLQPPGVEQAFAAGPGRDQCRVVVDTILAHGKSAAMVVSTLVLTLEGAKPQSVGSAITYARRYALTALLGLAAEEDDDAQMAQQGHRDARHDERPPQQDRRYERPPQRQQPRQPPPKAGPPEKSQSDADIKAAAEEAKKLAAARKWLVAHGLYRDGMADADVVPLYHLEWSHMARRQLEAEGVQVVGLSDKQVADLVRERERAKKAQEKAATQPEAPTQSGEANQPEAAG